jgi:hypothetical protein
LRASFQMKRAIPAMTTSAPMPMAIAVPPPIEPLPDVLVAAAAALLGGAVVVEELTAGAGKFDSGLEVVGLTATDDVDDADALGDADELFLAPAATATPGPTSATPGPSRARDIDANRAAAPLRRRMNDKLVS